MLVLDDTHPRRLAGVLRRLRTELGKLPAAARAPGAVQRLPAEGVGLRLVELEADPAGRLLALCPSLHQAALDLAEDLGQACFSPADVLSPVTGA